MINPSFLKHCAIVFLLAIFILLIFWAALPPNLQVNESTDYLFTYEPVARNLMRGDGFYRPDKSFSANPPGYPLILAGLFLLSQDFSLPENITILAFILFSFATSAVIIFLLARNVYGSRLALFGVTLWITYPFLLWLTKQPNPEIAFLPPFLGGIYLFWLIISDRSNRRWIMALTCGTLIGFSMLIKPITIGLGIVLATLILFLAQDSILIKRLLLSTTLLLGNFLVILPWEGYVYQQTGQVILISNHGPDSILDGLTFATNTKNYREHIKIPPDPLSLMQNIQNSLEINTNNAPEELMSKMLDLLRENPSAALKLIFIKALRSWYATDSGRYERMILAIHAIYLIAIGWGGYNSWKSSSRTRTFLLIVSIVSVYFWIMTTSVLSILRYMTPAMGLLILLIPIGLSKQSLKSLNPRFLRF